MKYRVVFEIMDLGELVSDSVSFDGTMTKEEAEYWCLDFKCREGVRNVRIEQY